MPAQNAVSNQSVEEILASIRQAIADDEARRGRTLTPIAPPAGRAGSATSARNLTSANDDDDWDVSPDFDTQNVIDLAIEKAIDGALNESPAVGSAPAAASRSARPVNGTRDEQRSDTRTNGAAQRPLLSARTGAAVAASFEDLARNVASLSPSEIREMAQEMLRPMLKGWLDDNLPALVERLVRDEIERVSRGH
jgi:cell pole-organizing protein PopZ